MLVDFKSLIVASNWS